MGEDYYCLVSTLFVLFVPFCGMIFSLSFDEVPMNTARLISGIVVLLFVATAVANAQEWTQWRGPARDGSVSTKNTPAVWPETLKQTWRVEIGEGYSSPVVADGKVFIHGRRDPEEIVSSINLADGKILWQQKYQAEFE